MRPSMPPKSGKSTNASRQARNPEDVHVGEQRDQAEHRDDLELQLVSPVRDPLWQRMQAKKQNAEFQNRGQ